MGTFVKKRIVEEITAALNGLFNVTLEIETGGLTIEEASISGDGFALGNYSASSTKLFPATTSKLGNAYYIVHHFLSLYRLI